MRTADINSYRELEKYLKLELARQTTTRTRAEIELPQLWFNKLIKFLVYYFRDNKDENVIKQDLPRDLKKFYIRINKVNTTIIRE